MKRCKLYLLQICKYIDQLVFLQDRHHSSWGRLEGVRCEVYGRLCAPGDPPGRCLCCVGCCDYLSVSPVQPVYQGMCHLCHTGSDVTREKVLQTLGVRTRQTNQGGARPSAHSVSVSSQ